MNQPAPGPPPDGRHRSPAPPQWRAQTLMGLRTTLARNVLHPRYRGRGRWTTSVGIATVLAGISLGPSAAADSTDAFQHAVTSTRNAASCIAWRLDPLVEQVTQIANQSTDVYLDHNARSVPLSDPLPNIPVLTPLQVLNDRGSKAKKAKLLQGAGHTEADAISFITISGYNTIPDCTYTDYGLSLLHNRTSGYFLAAMVVAGA